MRVLLTGGTGFIGQHLATALLRRGWHVTALVRKPESAPARSLARKGARLAQGDVTERESMRAAIAAAELVVHNAGHYEFGVDAAARERMRRINVEGTENVLGLAQEALATGRAAPRTVYVSSVVAFGDTGDRQRDETFVRHEPCRTAYEQSKTDAHEVAVGFQHAGLPVVIACPNGVVGANDHSVWGYFLRLYLNRLLPPFAWSPSTRQAVVDVRDLAEGIALAAEKGRVGETYFFCGQTLTLRQILTLWRERPGGWLPPLWLPPGLAAALFAPLEPLERALGLPAFLSRETVRAASAQLDYSSAKAQRELGWQHREPRQMWLEVLDRERELLAQRRERGQSWRERLRPLEVAE
jgi:dihydroflavonol-4-reductase